ncbi:MAG: hypothetical protein WCP46_00065 [Alphaproteobacteria bacterium]
MLQRCGKTPEVAKPKIDTVVRIDTLYIHDTVPGKPILVYSKPEIKWRDSIQYIADTSYEGLLAQYDALGDKYFSRNVYKTPFKLGVYGDATVIDTIVANKIMGNNISYNIKIPIVTNTITIKEPYKPKNQVYFGGGINGNQSSLINSVEMGFLYKNKKDQIFGIKAQQSFTYGLSFGVNSYWKIKF